MGLFRKDKSKVIDGAVKLIGDVTGMIDDSKFKPEEKARFQVGMADATAEFVKSTLSENTERSRTRRELAILIIRFELLILTASVILFKIDKPLADYLYKIATNDPINYLVLGVGAFFFGAHIVRAMQK